MSEASEVYIEQLLAEKKQLREILNALQTIIQVRQSIDALEARSVPLLPLGPGTKVSMEDIGAHINALGDYYNATKMAGDAPGAPQPPQEAPDASPSEEQAPVPIKARREG